MQRRTPPLALALTVWGLGAALYFIGFFHRVAPAVLTRELAAEFGLTAAALGNLSAFYFYSYVAVQVPTGMLVDRYGPRRILTTGAVLAAVGGMLFAGAHTLALVEFGRLLVGASVGVAFVAMMKLSTHWFHASRFATIAGVALGTGLVGAISAGAPLRWLADAYGWRAVLSALAAATGVLAVAIWTVVRDDPEERGYASFLPRSAHAETRHSMAQGLARALSVPNVWLIFFVNGALTVPLLTFAGLWGVPFLTTHYGHSTAVAAAYCSLMLMAWGIGGPVIGALSDRYRKRKPLYIAGTAVTAAGCAVIFTVPGLPTPLLIALLAITGFASGAIMIGFAYAKESVPAPLAGTTGGISNMGNMLGGMVMQPAVGWVLDRMWRGDLAQGLPTYHFGAYRAAFALMLVWLVVSILLAALTRETYCRQHP
ncbi:MAG TPA: MFS transporter [Burkholderiales bacterium]|nr:MFS transporter [Burkholderiales bacterium]